MLAFQKKIGKLSVRSHRQMAHHVINPSTKFEHPLAIHFYHAMLC